jgi:hypothetical protein
MSIGVQSYPELYTLLLGWALYDKLWALLTETGIAYLPFIGLILKNIAQSYMAQGHAAAGQALRSMEMNLLAMLLLIFFGTAPLAPLNVHTVSYSPLCEKEKTYHPGATGTTYDKAFAVPTGDITVPLWWYAVLSVSEGITSAANTLLGCVPDLRKMVTEVDMTQITDVQVKLQLQDFQTMCYAKAKMQFFKDTQENKTENTALIQDNIKKFGIEDTEWMGSHALNAVYYPHLQATRPVPGFRYDKAKDINAASDATHPPAYGMPACDEWWNSQDGLRNRLYQALPKSFFEEYKSYLNPAAKDDVIKKILSHATRGYRGYAKANDQVGDLSYSHLVSAVGIWSHQLEEYPKLYAAAQAAPIIQALLLLMIYVFLPFAIVFSSYKPVAFISGAVIVFSIIFWSFIWHLVSWVDKSLMQALYANWFARQGAGAALADMIIGVLVIAAPLFWFMLMGSLGVVSANFIGSIFSSLGSVSSSSAKTGASVVASVAKAGMNTAASA